jgi:SOS response regulatory protein OraA/RecX
MLARRAYSVAELRRALERTFASNGERASDLSRLRHLGFLHEKKFAVYTAVVNSHQVRMGLPDQ